MMGEEPLEVAREHQYSLYPERFFHDSSTVSTDPVGTQVSRDRLPNAYGSTAQVSASSNNKQSAASTAPRRVRHRVDAGEPRGCFSNNTPNTWSPRLPFGNRFHPHFLPPPPPHAPHFVYARTPPPQYFGSASIQPMKMLSEFISSVTPSGSSRDNQLLLREMLCKNAQNNNEYEGQTSNNKSKLDGMVSIMMEKLSNTPEPEVSANEQGRENEEQSAEANAMGDETEPTNKAAADLLNNNTQGQKNKRKKYQPQRSDLLDIPDEIENQDDEIVEDQGEELKTLKRKLDEYSDLDEDEALMLRIQSSRSSAATTNPDDLECEFENEEDEQEAMINDDLNHDKEREQEVGSRRTLPVVRNLMKERKHEAAPLTRSLLTTRIASSTPPPPPPPQQQQQIHQNNPNITSPLNKQTPPHMDLCSPPPFLNQWKENLKSTLITHINELVEAQFSLLLGGNLIPQALAASVAPPQRPQSNDPHRLRESNMKQEQKSTPPPSTPTPVKPLHLNGGSVLNTDKICVQNHEVKKLPVSRMSDNKPQQDYPPRPFPFMHDNIQRKIPPPFSTALVGLSNAHNTVQGIENMFDNDGALSLVVGKHADAVTPRKKRHKVTDTRLTPRAVSRLLNQDAASSSPCYDPQTSPNASPNHGIEPRSILQNGTPPPRDRVTPQTNNQDIQRNFNPFVPPQNPQFFHPGLPHPLSHHLAQLESPPMGNSLLHPALQNPSEYVERLREMSHGQEQRARDSVVVRERTEHHHAGIREYPSVRGLRDRGTGGSMMLSNDVLELIGRSGSAGGSDSDRESGSQFEMSSGGGMYCHTTSTLTPMHLRKAKLMFFWTRYPSSAVIKMYFPDIKFNKNNTAQLVKWFSNFREFYYIQMEKYARQALSEGVKQADDLVVTNDSELYRVLNLHYNRNNHIEVPTNFRFVVEQTLREFFKSIQAGKDAEQSWKKAIYKIIARLDDPVPEYFKSPNFLEQLE